MSELADLDAPRRAGLTPIRAVLARVIAELFRPDPVETVPDFLRADIGLPPRDERPGQSSPRPAFR